jgi:hypothetical protein
MMGSGQSVTWGDESLERIEGHYPTVLSWSLLLTAAASSGANRHRVQCPSDHPRAIENLEWLYFLDRCHLDRTFRVSDPCVRLINPWLLVVDIPGVHFQFPRDLCHHFGEHRFKPDKRGGVGCDIYRAIQRKSIKRFFIRSI